MLEFALSLPEAYEDQPWEEDTVAKVRKKIFVFVGGEGSTHMTVKLDREADFARLSRELMTSTRAEDKGCIQYAIYRRADSPRQWMARQRT